MLDNLKPEEIFRKTVFWAVCSFQIWILWMLLKINVGIAFISWCSLLLSLFIHGWELRLISLATLITTNFPHINIFPSFFPFHFHLLHSARTQPMLSLVGGKKMKNLFRLHRHSIEATGKTNNLCNFLFLPPYHDEWFGRRKRWRQKLMGLISIRAHIAGWTSTLVKRRISARKMMKKTQNIFISPSSCAVQQKQLRTNYASLITWDTREIRKSKTHKLRNCFVLLSMRWQKALL